MTRFYLTTAIDYANGEPHAGHAFEKVGADVIARYRRALGDDVHFVIGMDEHGQKVAQEAAASGLSPQELVDEVARRFSAVWDRLGLSHDDFIRTTEPRHVRAVQALIERIKETDVSTPTATRATTARAARHSRTRGTSRTWSTCGTWPPRPR